MTEPRARPFDTAAVLQDVGDASRDPGLPTPASDTHNLPRRHGDEMAGRYAVSMQVDRDHNFSDALRRVRSEYLEMPGLKLTRDQAARLWALDRSLCEAILSSLVQDRFLTRTANAAYVRSD